MVVVAVAAIGSHKYHHHHHHYYSSSPPSQFVDHAIHLLQVNIPSHRTLDPQHTLPLIQTTSKEPLGKEVVVVVIAGGVVVVVLMGGKRGQEE